MANIADNKHFVGFSDSQMGGHSKNSISHSFNVNILIIP